MADGIALSEISNSRLGRGDSATSHQPLRLAAGGQKVQAGYKGEGIGEMEQEFQLLFFGGMVGTQIEGFGLARMDCSLLLTKGQSII